ncbi:hypothetical protein [Chromobacterium sp. IIBBL 290-4]|uniref:hypothetical protein n=1 Tax=Chromobacterium sp. IIBBL 290-4 TaxID=2953890 RepID=UPI0020B872BA|nr:hypothetical protein [Chromobacterium sp. IIBBL 290-4]UTH73630.1 hypothetical protein NKT35_19120 [Chromobacterium sp. IIBBL 290-4]
MSNSDQGEGMFDHLLRKLGWDAESRRRARELHQLIDQLVDACDRRLRLLPGYLDALSPGMRASQAYLSTLTERLPPVLNLSRRSFATDPRLGLLFASPASLLEVLESSDSLRDFYLSASNGDVAWALMTMQRSETSRLGVALQDGELRNDVAQLVVSFDGHRLLMPCPSEQDFQRRSGEHALQVQAGVIARRLSLMEQARQQLEAECSRLQLHRQALRSETCVVIGGAEDAGPLPATAAEVDARLEEVRPQLDELRAQAGLEGVLGVVKQVLEHPDDYFSLETVTLTLNRMGIRVDSGEDGASELLLEEVVLGKIQPIRRALMPVRIERQAIAELREQFG